MNAIYLAFVVLPFAGSNEEGRIAWELLYPVSMPGTGMAVVKARAKPDPGYTITSARVRYWIGGSVLETKDVPFDSEGNLRPVLLRGLKRGNEYYVTVEVVQVKAGLQVRLCTDHAIISVR